jgi:hypothetical protein
MNAATRPPSASRAARPLRDAGSGLSGISLARFKVFVFAHPAQRDAISKTALSRPGTARMVEHAVVHKN